MKGFDVPARGQELFQFRSSVALILVKTCPWEGERLPYRWGSGSSLSAASAFGAPGLQLTFSSLFPGPYILAAAGSDG